MPNPRQKIDPYLFEAFETAEENEPEFEAMGPVTDVRQPMLLRLRNSQPWEAPAGFRVHSQVGTIVSGEGTRGSLRALDLDPNVVSVEASGEEGTISCDTSVPFIKATNVQRSNLAELGEEAIVAIIDTGIDVLHQAFQDGNQNTRVVEIWDQWDQTGPAPDSAYATLPNLTYGTLHSEADINRYIANANVEKKLGRDPALHGTHVASIAAGRQAGNFAGGVAPAAKIVLVRAKTTTDPRDPASLGYSKSHVDALAYIRAVAERLELPVVVNVSLGKNAGAHDGTSLLESAFDEFSGIGREPGYVIVKSAGNERNRHGHAKLRMSPNSLDELIWQSSDTSRIKDVFELWFKASDEFMFRLIPPGGSPGSQPQVTWANPTETRITKFGNKYTMSYIRYHKDNGDSRLLLTIRPGNAFEIESGLWKLEVEAGALRSPGIVHAWIERDNSRAIRFVTHLDEELTLSIPGTAKTVIAVGAVNSQFPIRNTSTSSYGPTRDGRFKPDVVAPGTRILAAEAGSTDGITDMTGTSMAAPHVTGAIALLLSRQKKALQSNTQAIQPNAVQICAALTQLTQNFTGHHTTSHGFGLLDAEALLKAFE